MARVERITPGTSHDLGFVRVALHLAHRVLGTTAPNPAVGAIIVDEETGEMIARGWTQPGGRPHAEVHALQRAGARARDKTMYVTLEPCSHFGRTPPCVDAILAAGIGRVVCAVEDPNPDVSGKGIALLRNAGVKVDVGLCAAEARWMAAGHILRMTQHRPFVQLKMAVSGDGLIAPGSGAPVWVTGPRVRAFAHLLRARADAILVGRKTVADDNPQLTCRLPGLAARSPLRVVLDPSFQTPATSTMIRSAGDVPVLLVGGEGREPPAFPAGVRTMTARTNDGRLDLKDVLAGLAQLDITRVMVEGGPTVARALYDADLIDEVMIARGQEALGARGRKPLLDAGLELFEDTERWVAFDQRILDGDRLQTFRRAGRLG